MKKCTKCHARFNKHSFIAENKIYCSPGCYVGDKHTGWIARVYKSLDSMGSSTRECKESPCCTRKYRKSV